MDMNRKSGAKSYIAENIKIMPTSGIRKFFDVANMMEDVVSLGVGEPDFHTPWHASEAGILSIERGQTAYTSNQGMPELRDAISVYLDEKYHTKYRQEEILVTVGASEGIDLALRAILNPGEEVLVPEPSYVSYKPCVVMAGGVPVPVNTQAVNEFRVTPQELEELITPKTKAIILPYPNNPTGSVMRRQHLEAIASVIIENDLIVISDEIYGELTYGEQPHVSIASLPGMWERTIVLNGFSKAFAMTGWRLGYAAAPAEFMEEMVKIHQYVIMCAPTVSQYAGLEALTNERREDELSIMWEAYDERRRVMVDGFRAMGLDCFEPQGAFYVFPSIQSTGLSSEEFCEKLLYERRTAVVPGTAFGESGEGFIRCSYAYSIKSIRIALERIEGFLKTLK